MIPGLERSPGGGHGNPLPVFLPGESLWTEEPGRLQSMESLSHATERVTTAHSMNVICESLSVDYVIIRTKS